jgi:hypothetical protein
MLPKIAEGLGKKLGGQELAQIEKMVKSPTKSDRIN